MIPPIRIFTYLRNKKGQGLVEYALILILVSIVAIAVIKVLGSETCNLISKAADEVLNAK